MHSYVFNAKIAQCCIANPIYLLCIVLCPAVLLVHGIGPVDMNETLDLVRIDNETGSIVYPPARPFFQIAEELGTRLALPSWLEPMHSDLERILPPVLYPKKQ
jgi:hypothetical protein